MLTEIKTDVSKALKRAVNKSKKVSTQKESWRLAEYCEITREKLFNKYSHVLDDRIQNIEYRYKDFIEDIDYLYVIKDKTCRRFG